MYQPLHLFPPLSVISFGVEVIKKFGGYQNFGTFLVRVEFHFVGAESDFVGAEDCFVVTEFVIASAEPYIASLKLYFVGAGFETAVIKPIGKISGNIFGR